MNSGRFGSRQHIEFFPKSINPIFTPLEALFAEGIKTALRGCSSSVMERVSSLRRVFLLSDDPGTLRLCSHQSFQLRAKIVPNQKKLMLRLQLSRPYTHAQWGFWNSAPSLQTSPSWQRGHSQSVQHWHVQEVTIHTASVRFLHVVVKICESTREW